MIKGHFILPFGYAGIIEDIKSYGFILPDWIDYSYDKIQNNDQRFAKFLKTVKETVEIPLESWHIHYTKSFDIIRHNRQVFFNRPYDSLYDSINTYIKEKDYARSYTCVQI